MANSGITFNIDVDNSDAVLRELKSKVTEALTLCGETARDHAKTNLTVKGAVDTGALRSSVTTDVHSDYVLIGTAIKYGVYIEYGTGAANVAGGTTKPHWIYYSERDGKFHMAFPQAPRPWLKPALADNANEYKHIIENVLKK